MAVTYSLGPMPKWVMINQQGTLAGGATLTTYSSLTRQPKAVYANAAASIVYTNPIVFDLNGTAGPFYWQYDSAAPDDLYFLEAKDSAGNVLWTVDNYMPQGTGGGGGTVTVYQSLTNYIANSAMIDHISDTASPIGSTNLVIAPSNHVGFTPALINPIIGTWGAVGPDIRFVKDNTTATDQITFVDFSQADNAFSPSDVTPVSYVRYQCTVSPSAETYKCFQFPICQKVKNLNNQPVTFQCWARVQTNPVTLNVYTRQYFGSGTGASAEVRFLAGTMALTTGWQEFNIQFTVPSTAGKSIGNPGSQTDDDALYIQLQMPLGAGALCDVWFTKPTLHLGSIEPDADFDSYDQINSIIQTPRTGDIRTSMLPGVPGGWVIMNDGTIGNSGSSATTRANKDTFQLYKTLWDGVTDAWAPVSTGRGATAQADFVANKTLSLPKALGRVLAGQNAGFATSLTFTAVALTDIITVSSTAALPTGTPVVLTNTGGALPAPLAINTPYYVINLSPTTLKLAISADRALLGTAMDLTTDGSGTNTLLSALGALYGEGVHQLTIAELAAHTHNTYSGGTGIFDEASFVNGKSSPSDGGTSSTTGGNVAHNTLQPTVFTNFFIKL